MRRIVLVCGLPRCETRRQLALHLLEVLFVAFVFSYWPKNTKKSIRQADDDGSSSTLVHLRECYADEVPYCAESKERNLEALIRILSP